MPPPSGAVPPDNTTGEFGFDFTRFGVRVPAVLVSPLIQAGTVFRVPAGSTPIDHTSILKTVQQRWGLPSLTARDAAAPGFGGVLTLTAPRTDDALAGVTVPAAGGARPSAAAPSHLQEVQADLISRQYPAGQHPAADALAAQDSGAAYANYIRSHGKPPRGRAQGPPSRPDRSPDQRQPVVVELGAGPRRPGSSPGRPTGPAAAANGAAGQQVIQDRRGRLDARRGVATYSMSSAWERSMPCTTASTMRLATNSSTRIGAK